ncbi:macro domain-containing protein [Pectobacterium atrosepticum]|jgi:O-acetyl-ADP-ribose deacetylase (regulator of RNase III)|uniref:macro domain-containing protein n=1 Tax=Pectobacterium atrosepticum TaxID=29471 RepID=UPI003016EF61
MSLINVVHGDITSFSGDVIVNAANRKLRRGGGVSGAIYNIAGQKLVQACKDHIKQYGQLSDGDVALTPAFNLRCRNIIHAVGPRWYFGFYSEKKDNLLFNAYHGALKLAYENSLSNIAFPCISTGHYYFPHDRAAKIAVHTVTAFLQNNPTITVWFYCLNKQDVALYNKRLSLFTQSITPAQGTCKSWLLKHI